MTVRYAIAVFHKIIPVMGLEQARNELALVSSLLQPDGSTARLAGHCQQATKSFQIESC